MLHKFSNYVIIELENKTLKQRKIMTKLLRISMNQDRYDIYCQTCKEDGKEPLPFEKWMKSQKTNSPKPSKKMQDFEELYEEYKLSKLSQDETILEYEDWVEELNTKHISIEEASAYLEILPSTMNTYLSQGKIKTYIKGKILRESAIEYKKNKDNQLAKKNSKKTNIVLADRPIYKGARPNEITKEAYAFDEIAKLLSLSKKTLKLYMSFHKIKFTPEKIKEQLNNNIDKAYNKYLKYCMKNNLLPISKSKWLEKTNYIEEPIPVGYSTILTTSKALKRSEATIKEHVKNGYFESYSDQYPWIITNASIEKYKNKDLDENLIKCEGCFEKFPYTYFVNSSKENYCRKCCKPSKKSLPEVSVCKVKSISKDEELKKSIHRCYHNGYYRTTTGLVKEVHTTSLTYMNLAGIMHLLAVMTTSNLQTLSMLANTKGEEILFKSKEEAFLAMELIREEILNNKN